MFNLKDKVAIVTGAGSGIGESIARVFACAGARVYACDVNEEAGRRVTDSIGSSAVFIRIDVAQETSCNSAAQTILAQTSGACDILVNNAGIGHVGTVLTTTSADLDRLSAVNVKGTLHMCRAFLPPMFERRWGSVINIASIGGVLAVRDRFAYCATKFAVVGMTKCMALDHADTLVRFNAICPGRVETPFVQERLKEYADPKQARAQMAATQALGRMGTPDEIAAAALYLASDESAFVTGSTFMIDGGWSVGK
jgi:NAD(P)-dependent dehydrogenase (short-subunit alcohol dehydrogenase family)